jgi:retinol-binding protein 3
MKNYLFLLAVVFCHVSLAQDNTTVQINSEVKNKLVFNICTSLNRNYVYPEKAKAMVDFLKQQNQKGAYDSVKNEEDLANLITKDLRKVYADKHLRITYDPDLEKDILAFLASKNGAKKIALDDIEKDKKKNFHFRKVEILPSNIGYIELNGFAVPSQSTSQTIRAAFQFVANTDALIIDLRNNFGGNGKTAGEIIGYFFETKTYSGRTFNKIENKWTNEYIENKQKTTNRLLLNMPIFLLVSNRTFSAAEAFAYNLQNLKGVVVIGVATHGGAHVTRSFSLGNGFVGFIPYSRGENAITKTDWEGTGVIPNIEVTEENSLATAKTKILEAKLSEAKSDTEKRQIKYLINYYKSKSTKHTADSAKVSSFVGDYEYFEVRAKDNLLLFKDTKNHQEPIQATAISDTLFQIGDDYQIEFLMDDKGNCTAFKMFWDDGYEEMVLRNKK